GTFSVIRRTVLVGGAVLPRGAALVGGVLLVLLDTGLADGDLLALIGPGGTTGGQSHHGSDPGCGSHGGADAGADHDRPPVGVSVGHGLRKRSHRGAPHITETSLIARSRRPPLRLRCPPTAEGAEDRDRFPPPAAPEAILSSHRPLFRGPQTTRGDHREHRPALAQRSCPRSHR